MTSLRRTIGSVCFVMACLTLLSAVGLANA